MTIRILLADDHDLILTGVEYALNQLNDDVQVVARAATPDQLLAALAPHRCDLVITDFLMPGGDGADGLAMLNAIRQAVPALPIVVLTRYVAPLAVQAMRDLGVMGILSKQDPLEQLAEAVRAVMAGHRYLGSAVRSMASEASAARAGGAPVLSWREVEILRLVGAGRTTTEVARHLRRTVQTASTQKRSAMRKLGLRSDVEIYRYAFECGLVV
ncbi:Two component transcriptional regulator, LuxR family [Cupriavidus taiwanensis]|uniref:Two component transcriptional regulator, LuxR family n=1 Tax=Cupriavidus taiwanensis TaxID=164546 RepID=A0A375E6A4_9BURK|nr:response regulator transcription factor [Cupriavidus taiwanensis]SOZ64432.1 Two component transcriptional regulator, LuxR family [Cupriavidus taiwanensis]SOZ65139.1 Two component transcriptional regulator, LuxR family [Cupriavidus taiwanensis]SOZ68805.1 Two component transcriptional regulator, LuxR family [Cupriavidus taiwanensis]SPA08232.1 Two component transcriptional regulator, LuxR family [Cupriavidus taiwanensis]